MSKKNSGRSNCTQQFPHEKGYQSNVRRRFVAVSVRHHQHDSGEAQYAEREHQLSNIHGRLSVCFEATGTPCAGIILVDYAVAMNNLDGNVLLVF